MPEPRQGDDRPRIPDDDSVEARVSSGRRSASADQGGIEALARNAIAAMSDQGPQAESRYQVALASLARQGDQAVSTVSGLYQATPESEYRERWSQVFLLTELHLAASVPVLEAILDTPIPPERMPGMITHSTVGEETVIRTTAIEGLERLAASGDESALALIRRQVSNDSLSVRRAAVQAYLAVSGPGARDELLDELPESDRFLVDIRRVEVHEVPQPTLDIRSEEPDAPPPPPFSSMRPRGEE